MLTDPTVPAGFPSAPRPGYLPPAANAGLDRAWEASRQDIIRRIAFFSLLPFIFFRFSMLHEYLTVTLGANTYVLYLFGPAAILGVLLTGGIQRSFRGWTGIFWVAFLGWMILAIPTSTWRGGSAQLLKDYAKADIPMFFMIAGLTLTWVECRRVMYTIAAAGVVNLVLGRVFLRQISDRFEMAYSNTIGNSNDFAAHLLLVLPFILFVAFQKGRLLIWRLAAAGAMAYGAYLILGTASRGALVSLFLLSVFVFFKGSVSQRIAALALMPVAAILLFAMLPQRTTQRLLTFSVGTQADQEAVESRHLRQYLLLQSLRYTLEFPIFGVGPGQFSTYEGTNNRIIGDHGHWRPTHNLLTQVSSECGIPAFLLFAAALVSTYRLLNRTYRQARQQPQQGEVALAAFCGLLSFVGFFTAALFLNLAYRFYLPALSGLAVALAAAAAQEFPAAQPSLAGELKMEPLGYGQSRLEKKFTAETPTHSAARGLDQTERSPGRLKREESGASMRELGRRW